MVKEFGTGHGTMGSVDRLWHLHGGWVRMWRQEAVELVEMRGLEGQNPAV